jgi:integrase
MAKLTKTILDGAELRPKPYFMWCSDLPGFGVRIFPGGRKSFYADYYNRDGQRKRMSLGPYGKLTVDEARRMARITLGSVLSGEDPALERKTRRSSLTVTELCDNYVEAVTKGLVLSKNGRLKKVSTLDTDRGRIERHIKPLLGKKLVMDLKRSDISKFIRDVTSGKTAVIEKSGKLRGKIVVTGGAGTASRTAGLLGGILSYAISEGVVETNPVHGVPRSADRKKERRLSEAEYGALGKALQSDVEPWQAIAAIKLLAFTGCRKGEIANLTWAEVDLEGQALRLGDSKTGASVRPLGSAAAEALKEIMPEKPTGYVLPGSRNPKKPFGSLPRAIERIFKAAKIEGATAHTLRHSFASVAADLNYSDSTIAALLGHAGTTITSRYVHRLDSVLIAAADEVAEAVRASLCA